MHKSEVYSWKIFYVMYEFCSQQLNQDSEHVHHPKVPLCFLPPLPVPSSKIHAIIGSVFCWYAFVTFPRILYDGEFRMFSLSLSLSLFFFGLTYFIQCNYLLTHPCVFLVAEKYSIL